MPDEQKIRWNLQAVENAIAQQWLEGLVVPPEVKLSSRTVSEAPIKN